MKRLGKLLLTWLCLWILVGCAINRPIKYNMSEVSPSLVTQLKTVTLNIAQFADIRNTVSENMIVFTAGRETEIDGERVCINSEEHYNKEPVASQITTLVANHFRQRAAFKDVLTSSKESADFQLQGSIRQFYAQQNFSYAAAVGSQFGIVGALFTMSVTTPGVIKIEFTDLTLTDKSGKQIKALGNITKTFQDEMSADAYCWQPFRDANAKLKEVVDLLSEEVEKCLCEILAASTETRGMTP